ncbi:MAG: TonB-dependent receptor [Bacteroidaceae bacterium]
MKEKKIVLLIALFGCLSQSSRARQTISDFGNETLAVSTMTSNTSSAKINENKVAVIGTIVDQNGQPIIGASVLEVGTTNGTITDIDGKFKMTAASGKSLKISYIGYVSQTVVVTGKALKVILREDTKTLDEVVVIGYGVIKKKDLTGAIAGLKQDQLDQQSNANLGNAIQGKMAGVTVESAGGAPGSSTNIQIRGAGSLNNNNPLIIVDDIAVENMNNISPYDIANIQVLKDASAAAIYGSRAANGVILITTKRGSQNKMSVNFNATLGVASVNKTLDLCTTDQWVKISNAAHDAAGMEHLAIAENPEVPGKGTDWQDAIFRSALTQNYNLGLNGGSEKLRYSMSLGYFGQDGVIEETDYKRFNMRIKSDYTKGIFKVGETVLLSREKSDNMPGVGGQGGNVIGCASMAIPAFKIYDDTAVGGYAGPTGDVVDVWNPVAALNLLKSSTTNYKALIDLYTEISLAKGLKYKLSVGATYNEEKGYNYTPCYQVGQIFKNTLNTLSESSAMTQYYQAENILTYLTNFGKHSINLMAGYTMYNNKYHIINAGIKGMPDGIKQLGGGTLQASASGSDSESKLFSYMGRAIYSYDNRYILTATIRRDGSSRFSKNNRWGNFPSISAAWNITSEKFFKNLNTPIDELKLRVSYGVLGNQEIGDYQYMPLIEGGEGYVVGRTNTWWDGSIQRNYPASDLKWEETKTTNIGIDLSMWNGKFTITADYFKKRTSDLLLRVPIPLSVGSPTNPYANAGKIDNNGFEFATTYNGHVGDFKYSVSGNLSAISNKVKELSTGSQRISGASANHHGAAVTYTMAGLPMYTFLLVKTDGLFRTQEELDAYKEIQPNAKLGDIRYIDYNGDKIIDGNDRQNCGSAFPDFTYGLRLDASYKNFDFSIFFQGTQGNKIYNGEKTYTETAHVNTNYDTALLNSYTFNKNSNIPRLDMSDPNNNSADFSNRFLENGSYFRCKTAQLGYTLPGSLLQKINIEKMRIFIAGDNLFTITNYDGFNPDIAGNGLSSRGVDFRMYPLSKTFQVGLQLNF